LFIKPYTVLPPLPRTYKPKMRSVNVSKIHKAFYIVTVPDSQSLNFILKSFEIGLFSKGMIINWDFFTDPEKTWGKNHSCHKNNMIPNNLRQHSKEGENYCWCSSDEMSRLIW